VPPTVAGGRSEGPPGTRPLTVVIAPDSFKGSLSSIEVARALADGWRRVRPFDEIVPAPLADGGEGTLLAIETAGGWTRRDAPAHDPLGREIVGHWLQSTDGGRGFIELAVASGLSRLEPAERDALRASSLGTGEILRAALDAGVRRLTLGLGGSATTDGGSGILRALGVRLLDVDGQLLPAGGAALAGLRRVDLSGLDPRLAEVDLRIASDVDNPLLGPRGAAATYGPQKGASPSQVAELDAALAVFAERMAEAAESIGSGGRSRVATERDRPGAGAAGGTTFGLACLAGRLRSFAIVAGIDVVTEETDLAGKLRRADIVITGEGRIDEQTGFGKTAMGVARRAAEAGVPCVAVGGGVAPAGIEALRPWNAIVVPVVEAPMTVAQAMAAGAEPVVRCGERIARLVSAGLDLAARAR